MYRGLRLGSALIPVVVVVVWVSQFTVLFPDQVTVT